MINISQTTKTACNSDKLIFREYIVVDNTIVDTKVKMSATAFKDKNFIGSFNLKTIEFEVPNDINYKKKEVVYYNSVDGESFKIGTFIVTDVNDSDTFETVKVTAMDYGLKFADEKGYSSVLDYSSGGVTFLDIIQEICDKVGVELENETLTNDTFIVDSNQFTDSLDGDVVSAVAGMSCNFATINENDKLEFIFKKETNEIITDYVDLDDKRDTQPITCVSLGMSQIDGENVVMKDDDLIAIYGENWLILNDNPFAYTQQKREQLITAIFNKVKGFGYSSFESKYSFKPYMQLGDLIQFKNKEGQLVNSIILKIDTKYDDITLSAPSITKSSVNYQNNSLYDEFKNTQIVVDKALGEITSTVENISTTINDGYVTRSELSSVIIQTVSEIDTKISETGGLNNLKNPYFYEMNGNIDEWAKSEVTTYEIITDNTEVEQNTICKTELVLNNGSLSQEFDAIIGQDYTISFKYKKAGVLNKNSYVRIYRNSEEYIEVLNTNVAQNDRQEVSLTYNATVNKPRIEIFTDNDNLYISDLIVQVGLSKVFSPNANETLGLGHKMTKNNLKMYDLGQSGEYSELDYNDLKFYKGSALGAEYGLNGAMTPQIEVKQTLKVGNLTTAYLSDNVVVEY